MSGLDPDITNGTCYYAYDKAAGPELVPCGNAGIEDVPCCFAGDYCDAGNTCYDEDTGNTYLAGCTDRQYTDRSCPWKSGGLAAQEWVGLTRCGAVDEAADEWAWEGCPVDDPADYTAPARLASCGCGAGKATLLVAGQALLRHASLPGSAGGSISWVSGYAVTAAAAAAAATSTSTSTSTSATGSGSGSGSGSATAASTGGGSVVASASATATATATATGATAAGGAAGSGSGSTLTAGAKAGIAVGSAGAVLSVLAVAAAVFLHRRRRRRRRRRQGDSGGGGGVGDRSPAAEAAPPVYTGFKTELPADEPAGPKGPPQAPGPVPGVVTPELGSSGLRGSALSMVSELSSGEGADRSRLNSPVYPTMVSIAELQG